MIDSRKNALVIGAGVGGLVASAALARHFEHVLVIDKDTLPDNAQSRKGVGQGSHLHSLLLGGKQILEQFFPGLSDDLRQAGSNVIRAGIDQQIHEYGVWLPQRDLGYDIYTQSRYLLEQVIRERVNQIDNITVKDDIHVDSLILEETTVEETGVEGTAVENTTVKGVNAHHRGGDNIELLADIVIDASGRGGKFVNQLAKSVDGIDAMDTIQSNIIYASAFIKKPKQWLNHKENILIIAEPDKMAGGALIDIEDDHWCVSLHGRNGLVPPKNIDDWIEFAKNLPNARIAERLMDAQKDNQEMEGVYIFKKPLSTWRRFDKAPLIPANYFPLGDVITSINPTFGQGMTVAFSHCLALDNALSENAGDLQAHYVKKACENSSKAWRVCAAYDASFKQDDEKSQRNFEIMRSLSLKRQEQAIENIDVHRKLFETAQMISAFG